MKYDFLTKQHFLAGVIFTWQDLVWQDWSASSKFLFFDSTIISVLDFHFKVMNPLVVTIISTILLMSSGHSFFRKSIKMHTSSGKQLIQEIYRHFSLIVNKQKCSKRKFSFSNYYFQCSKCFSNILKTNQNHFFHKNFN